MYVLVFGVVGKFSECKCVSDLFYFSEKEEFLLDDNDNKITHGDLFTPILSSTHLSFVTVGNDFIFHMYHQVFYSIIKELWCQHGV